MALLPSTVLIVHLALLQAAGFHFGKKPLPLAPPDRGPACDNAELWKKYGQPAASDSPARRVTA